MNIDKLKSSILINENIKVDQLGNWNEVGEYINPLFLEFQKTDEFKLMLKQINESFPTSLIDFLNKTGDNFYFSYGENIDFLFHSIGNVIVNTCHWRKYVKEGYIIGITYYSEYLVYCNHKGKKGIYVIHSADISEEDMYFLSDTIEGLLESEEGLKRWLKSIEG